MLDEAMLDAAFAATADEMEAAGQTIVPGADARLRAGDVRRNLARPFVPEYTFALPKSLSVAGRDYMTGWIRRMRESMARSVRVIPTIAQLSPVVAARNARLAAWANANDWRTAKRDDMRAQAVTLPCPVRQRQIARLEGERAALTCLPPVRRRKVA